MQAPPFGRPGQGSALPEVRSGGETFSKVTLLRALRKSSGRTAFVSYAAHALSDQGTELVIADRFPKTLATIASIEEDARVLCDLPHPNLAMVRDVIVDPDAVVVLSDFIEGERLDELRRVKELMPIEIGLRILVDVLSALSAIHGARKGLAHGQLAGGNVIVGVDGVARVSRGFLGRGGADLSDNPSIGYLAPEALRGEVLGPAADIYSAGVLLWETITQKRLFPAATKASLLANVGKPRPKATPPPSSAWAAALADVADKALSSDPAGRYATASEMAAAVRLIVRAKLAMPPKVAAWVAQHGDRIFQRRAEIDVPMEQLPRVSRPELSPQSMRVLDEIRPPSKPPAAKTPNAPPVQAPVIAAPPPDLFQLADEDVVSAPESRKPVVAPTPPPAPVIAATPPPAVAPTPPPAPILVEAIAPPPDEREAVTVRKPNQERKKRIVVGVLGLAIVIIALAGTKIILRSGTTTPLASTTHTTGTQVPTMTAPTETAPPMPTPTPTATETVVTPETTASEAPTIVPTGRHRPKPKSTYDPEGI